MEKQIYKLSHKYKPEWVYIGATNQKYLSSRFGVHWRDRLKENTKKAKAMRGTKRSDWIIEQLHDFSADWRDLEAYYITKYDSLQNGINSTESGQVEVTEATRKACSKTGKITGRINGKIAGKLPKTQTQIESSVRNGKLNGARNIKIAQKASEKPVIVEHIETGTFYKYTSITQAGLDLKIWQQHLSLTGTGKRKHTGGYRIIKYL